jgi:tetratricopeptide (TPR) repeat protein
MKARVRFASILLVSVGAGGVALATLALVAPMSESLARGARRDGGEELGDESTASRFIGRCLEGNRRFLQGDAPGALESYRAAHRLSPKNPWAYYLEAEALLSLERFSDAEKSLQNALGYLDARQAPLKAKILFLVAEAKERQKLWDDARLAWKAYEDWVIRAVDGGGTFPLTALERIKLADEAVVRDRVWAPVRERADATVSGTVFNEMPKVK